MLLLLHAFPLQIISCGGDTIIHGKKLWRNKMLKDTYDKTPPHDALLVKKYDFFAAKN